MSAPKIGFDARMWSHPGIGRYIRELLTAMAAKKPRFPISLLGSPEDFGNIISPEGFSARKSTTPIYGYGEQLEMPFLARGLSLLHVPHFNVPVLRRKNLVATIHDLTYIHEPAASRSRYGRDYARFLFGHIARTAAAVITVSEYTRQDLLKTFPKFRADRVFVVPEAASGIFRRTPDLPSSAKPLESSGRPFILFVGSLKPHKNLSALLAAVRNLRDKKRIDHQLLIVGRRDPKHPEILKHIEATPSASYLGELPDERLAELYNLADLFVLPSLREGFGLPVVEAMACGAPVVVSNRTSLPEIAGEAGQVFDPERIDALEDVIYNVLKNTDLRQKMSQAGLERVKKFSWQSAAESTLQIYERVLG